MCALERTRAGMRAALELERWTFPAPLGYLNAPTWSSARLVHDPERGPLVKRALEDLATGRFNKQEVFNYLAPSESAGEEMVSQIFPRWNQLGGWLRQVEGLRMAA